MAVCAVAAFLVAFFAAGAGSTSAPPRTTTHPRPVSFSDPAASAVAAAFVGHPAALKLPSRPHVKHHSKPAATVTPVAPAAAPAASATPNYTAPAVVFPPTHASTGKKGSGGSGHGTTTIP
jgi:hypothetical protein